MWRTSDSAKRISVPEQYRIGPRRGRRTELPAQPGVTVDVAARRGSAAQIHALFRLAKRQRRCFYGPTERACQNPADRNFEFADSRSDRARFISSLLRQVALLCAVLEARHAFVALSKVGRGVTEIQDE